MKKDIDYGQGGLLAFWNSLSVDERAELVKNLEDFHALISSLRGRGIITTDKHLTEITILKRTEETDLLVELRDKVNAQGIKIIYREPDILLKRSKRKKVKNP